MHRDGGTRETRTQSFWICWNFYLPDRHWASDQVCLATGDSKLDVKRTPGKVKLGSESGQSVYDALDLWVFFPTQPSMQDT